MEVSGEEYQLDQLIEEAGELIVDIRHYKRGRINKTKLIAEMAAVFFLLLQFLVLENREFKLQLKLCFKRAKVRLDKNDMKGHY